VFREIEGRIDKQNTVKAIGELSLHQSEGDLSLKKAKSVRADDCVNLLLKRGHTRGFDEEALRKLNKAKKTSPTDVTLEELIVELLVTHPEALNKTGDNEYIALI